MSEQSIIQLANFIGVSARVICFTLGVLFFFKKTNSVPNRFLGLLFIVLSLQGLIYSFSLYNEDGVLIGGNHIFTFIPIALGGPLLYLYCLRLIFPSREIKGLVLHLMPFFVLQTIEFSKLILFKLNISAVFLGLYSSQYNTIRTTLVHLSVIIYLILSIRIILKFEQWIKEHYSNIQRLTLSSLKNVLILLLAMWIILVISSIVWINLFPEINNRIAIIPFLIFFIIGMFIISVTADNLEAFPDIKYGNIQDESLNTLNVAAEVKRIIQLIEKEELYKNPSIKTKDLSEKLGLNSEQIASLLNKGLNKNFYQLINDYRLIDVKEKLKNIKKLNMTIDAIAYESGYNSRATFYREFKKFTGLTPKEFIKES